MIISPLNSIRFKKSDSNYPSFINTLLSEQQFYNDRIFDYCQRFLTTDTITIQVKSDSDTSLTVTVVKYDKSEDDLSGSISTTSYDQDGDATDDLFFYEFDIDMSTYTNKTYIKVEQDGETWVSEPFYADSDLLTELQEGKSLKVEYTNEDNSFQIDFSGDITFTFYVEAVIKDYQFGGDISIYDNQDEFTKLKETATRIFSMKTLFIPTYMAERLKLASACDSFVVNGVSYVKSVGPPRKASSRARTRGRASATAAAAGPST